MPSNIGRDEVRRLITEEAAQVLEVLPRGQYDWAHLPTAVHLPLSEMDGTAASRLDRGRPVVTYCNDFQ